MSISLFLSHRRNDNYEIDNIIKTELGEYEIQDRIASGGNGVVHKCIEMKTGNLYAIKFFLRFDQEGIKRIENEIYLMKEIKHPHLISLADSGQVEARKYRTSQINSPVIFENGRNKKVYDKVYERVDVRFIIMVLAEGNLNEFLKLNNGTIEYKDYIGQFKGLSQALGELHRIAIHRDIKPENILFKGDIWMLSDYGLCKVTGKDEDITRIDEKIGPKYWMSPEELNRVVGRNEEILKESDVYQMCSIFWYIVTGEHPTGILSKDDWNGPENIFQPIYQSLSHNKSKRPSDGNMLYRLLDESIIDSL